MKTLHKIILIVIINLICCSVIVFSQNLKILDSLFIILKNAGTDSSRLNIYSDLCREYNSSNSDTAIYFANLGLSLAIKTNNKRGMSMCYTNIGIVHSYQGNYEKAIDYFLRSLKITEEFHDKKGMSDCYSNIGSVHYYQGSYNKTIEYYLKSLKIDEELGNKKGMSKCYNNIGIIHKKKGNYDKAIEYYLKSLKIKEELGDKKGMSSCYNGIGNIHSEMSNYDKAIEYYLKSLKIKEEFDDKNGIATIYGNIALLNISLGDSAALSENQRLQYLYRAIEYGIKAIVLAQEIKALPIENDAANTLMIAYKNLGNFKKSFEYAEIYITTKDSMFSKEKINALTEMETKYQSVKKQLEIDKLGKEKELQISEMKKQRLIIVFIVCGLLFMLGFSVMLFRLFIQKKKANKIITDKNKDLQVAYEEINIQKEEIIVQRNNIQKQKEIIEEHQKEIEDSINYAKRIQQAVLPDLSVIVKAQPKAISDDKIASLQLSMTAISTPCNFALFDYFVLFKPKDIVSGDFYWAARINEWLILTVADCTGHGVPGAFMSLLGISFLNEIVRKKEVIIASDILNKLRISVIDALKQIGGSSELKDGMDIVLVAINTETLEMQFAGANNPCYVIASRHPELLPAGRQGVEGEATKQSQNDSTKDYFAEARNDDHYLIELKADKMPIGIYENMKLFTNQKYQLQQGDTIYLMSDGYEDQFGGPNRKKFLAKNLKNLLIANSQQPIADQKQILETTLKDWIGNNEQIDDITVIGIKI